MFNKSKIAKALDHLRYTNAKEHHLRKTLGLLPRVSLKEKESIKPEEFVIEGAKLGTRVCSTPTCTNPGHIANLSKPAPFGMPSKPSADGHGEVMDIELYNKSEPKKVGVLDTVVNWFKNLI